MRRMKPQKPLLQLVMLALVSVVSVLALTGESYAAIDCSMCHGAGNGTDMRPIDSVGTPERDPSTGAFKGSHQKHLGASAIAPSNGINACSTCHSNASYTTDANYNSSHRDGKIQMNTGVGYGKTFWNQTSVPQLSTCSAAACHNPYTDGTPKTTPVWATAAVCTDCHNYDTVPNRMATNAHGKHLDAGAQCSTCHTSPGAPGHVNGQVTVDATLGYNASTLKHAAAGPYTSTCTASCHDVGSVARGRIASPVWSGTAAACATCHAVTPATGSHTKHLSGGTSAAVTCGACHAGAVQGSNAGNNHLNGMINFSTGSAGSVLKTAAIGVTCSTSRCHSSFQADGGVGAPTYAAPVWGNAASGACTTCHSLSPTTASHQKHLNSGIKPNASCSTCHTAYGVATHADGNIDITTGYSQSGAPQNGYGTCSTASCHDAGRGEAGYGSTPQWGATPANCSTCHGTIPATGSHNKHVSGTQYHQLLCADCHTGYTQGVGPVPATHLDGTVQVNGYSTRLKGTAGAATCSTAVCHSTVQNNNGIGTPTPKTVTWGTPLVGGCAACHDATPATGSHPIHLAKAMSSDCALCHTGATTSTYNSANHVDGSIQVGGSAAGSYSQLTSSPGSGFGTCATSSCHSGANVGYTFPVKTATWGGTLDCSGCHAYPPLDTDHNGLDATTRCNSCHSSVDPNTTQTTALGSAFLQPSKHMNNVIDGGKCNACHGYPPVKSMTNRGTSGNYTGAKLASGNLAGGGVHDVQGHLLASINPADGFSPCLNCHPQGATHNTGFGLVSTTKVQVIVADKFKFNKDLPISYSAFQRASTAPAGNCSNVSCHFRPSPAWN